MTNKPNKATRSQPPRGSQESAPGRPAGPEAPDLSGNDRKLEFSVPPSTAGSMTPSLL